MGINSIQAPTQTSNANAVTNGNFAAGKSGLSDFLALLMAAVGNNGGLPQLNPQSGQQVPVKTGELPSTEDKSVDPDALATAAAQLPLLIQFLQTHLQQLQNPVKAGDANGEIAELTAGQAGNLQELLKELKELMAGLSQEGTDLQASFDGSNEGAQKDFTKLLSLLQGKSETLSIAETKNLLDKLGKMAEKKDEAVVVDVNQNILADLKSELPRSKIIAGQRREDFLAALDGSIRSVQGEFRVTNSPASLETVLQRVQGKATTLLPQAIAAVATGLESQFSATTQQNFSFDPNSAMLNGGLNGIKNDMQGASFGNVLNNVSNNSSLTHPAVMAASAQLQNMAAAKRNQTMTINLQPAELGAIEIKIRVEGGKIKASIVADKSETLDLMKSESSILEKSLQSAGLQMDGQSLSFDLREKNNQSFRNSSNGSRKDGTEFELDTINENAIRHFAVQSNIYGDNGKLDVKL